MRLDQPIDLEEEEEPGDLSGTPIALLEQVRARGDLSIVASVEEDEVQVEFPFGREWQRKLGVDRFLLLRQPRDGKRYAVVKSRQAKRKGRRRKRPEVRPEPPLNPYPPSDPVGRKLGYEGAGIMAYQTLDQMHPPMAASAELWSDADRWPEAAREHTRSAARAAGLKPGERLLDIGCGIGGPARLLVDEFGVEVHGVGNAEHMLRTAEEINARKQRWREKISVAFHDCQDPYGLSGFDIAWSMNMIYRVPDKPAMLRHAAQALRPGGRIMVEDWMLTENATPEDRAAMDEHHYAGAIADVEEMEQLLAEAGFSITAQEDFAHVGRTHMSRYFVPQFNEKVRPRLEADFSIGPEDGAEMAEQWVAGIELTIEMYAKGGLTYRRFVAVLGDQGQLSGGVLL